MAEPEKLLAPAYDQTNNEGLHNVLELMDRAYTEAMDATQSRNGDKVHGDDVRRISDKMKAIMSYIDWWDKQPPEDEPYTQMVYRLTDLEAPLASAYQNKIWYSVVLRLWKLRKSMRISQSRNSNWGFHPKDKARWFSSIAFLEKYFDEYITKMVPQDYPQTTSDVTIYTEDIIDASPGNTDMILDDSD